MSSSALQKSENSTESLRTSLGVGSRTWDCELKRENQVSKPSTKNSSFNDPAANQELFTMSGSASESSSCSTAWDTQEHLEFTVQQSGSLGQEILDAEGQVICWTLDEILAIRICRLLNQSL